MDNKLYLNEGTKRTSAKDRVGVSWMASFLITCMVEPLGIEMNKGMGRISRWLKTDKREHIWSVAALSIIQDVSVVIMKECFLFKETVPATWASVGCD